MRSPENCPHGDVFNPVDPSSTVTPSRQCALLAEWLGFTADVPVHACQACCGHEAADNDVTRHWEAFHLRNRLRCGDADFFFCNSLAVCSDFGVQGG